MPSHLLQVRIWQQFFTVHWSMHHVKRCTMSKRVSLPCLSSDSSSRNASHWNLKHFTRNLNIRCILQMSRQKKGWHDSTALTTQRGLAQPLASRLNFHMQYLLCKCNKRRMVIWILIFINQFLLSAIHKLPLWSVKICLFCCLGFLLLLLAWCFLVGFVCL